MGDTEYKFTLCKYRHRKIYQYQWEEFRQRLYEGYCPTPSQHRDDTFEMAWTTSPTASQTKLIEAGETELPTTNDEKTGAKINNVILKHSDKFIEIIHQMTITVSGFSGMGIMRTCSQLKNEVADMIYSGNTFLFDARGNAVERSFPWNETAAKEFEYLRHRIPGLEDSHGNPPRARQIGRAIERLFEKGYLPRVAYEDPFLHFCWVIGKENVQRLTKIKIQGHLHAGFNLDKSDKRPFGLGRILPIYTVVLKEVARNLRSLTLHMRYDDECLDMDKSTQWYPSFPLTRADDARGDEGKSDEEKLDSIVGRVVRELKGLKHLQLGDYRDAPIPTRDLKWGKAARWMEVVKNRSKDIALKEVEAKIDAVDDGAMVRQRGRESRRCGSRGGQRGGFRGRGRGRANGRGHRGEGSA